MNGRRIEDGRSSGPAPEQTGEGGDTRSVPALGRPGSARPPSIWTTLLRVLITGLVYWAAGRLALLMAIPPGYATAVWPAAGLALACCLKWGLSVTPGIALGSFCVNVATSFDADSFASVARSLGLALLIGTGAAAQAAWGSAGIRRFVGAQTPLESVRDISRFALIGGPLACTIAASVGVTTLCAAQVIPWQNFGFSWSTWWVGDTIGVLIFAPLALIFTSGPAHVRKERRLIVALPLLIGFSLVTTLFWRASAWESQRLRGEFEQRAAVLAGTLETTLTEYEEVVGSLSSLLRVVPEISRSSFRQFTQRPLVKYPAIQALGWSPVVTQAQRATFEAAARAEGYEDFTIKELDANGKLRTAAERPQYVVTYYLEPDVLNHIVLGFDVSSEPRRRQALQHATAAETVAASARVRLIQTRFRDPGVLIFSPVYSNTHALTGYTVAVFRMQDVVAAALKGVDRTNIALRISDADGSEVLYDELAGLKRTAADANTHIWTRRVLFAQRYWIIDATARPEYMVAHRSWQAWMVLAGGLFFVGLLGVVMLIATGRTSISQEIAARFGALVESSAQIVWAANAAGEMVEDSPSWRAFTGRTYQQWRGRGWLDALHPDDRKDVVRQWKHALKTHSSLQTEYRVKHVSGAWRWMAARAVPLLDEVGAPRAWVGMNTDVTEQKLLAEQFRLAIEAAPTGTLLFERDGRISLVNQQVERIFGYTRDELIGMDVESLLPERMREGHAHARSSLLEGGSRASRVGVGRDQYGLRKDGSEVPIEIGLTPINVGGSDVVLSSIVDTTERRRATEQFRLAIEASPTGMLLVDRAGTITLANRQVETLLGYERGELVGETLETLVPQDMRAEHVQHRRGFFSAPRVRQMAPGNKLSARCKDGSLVAVEVGLTPLHTPDGDFVLGSVVDIRERERAEREREALLNQLKTFNSELEERVQSRTRELSAALREREVMLQEIHHRVKNNLQVIASLINMQMRRMNEDASKEALEECKSRIHAIALIHEVLYRAQDYAHVRFSEYASILARTVLQGAGLVPSDVELRLAVEDVALPVDRAIPCGLILNELVTNALKHAFPNGRAGSICVELARIGTDQLRLTVRDDGVGLPQTFDITKSSSVGLQLVTTLAEQLDATLEVSSQGGTAFALTLSVHGLG